MNNKYPFFSDLVPIAFLTIFWVLYSFSLWTNKIAKKLIDSFNGRHGNASRSWGELTDSIQNSRKLASLLIIFGIIILASINLSLLPNLDLGLFARPLILITGLATGAAVLLRNLLGWNFLNLKDQNHGKRNRFLTTLEKASITAGVTCPELVIVSSTNPNCFCEKTLLGKPRVYITTALLNMASDNELDAIASYQTAGISSNKMSFQAKISFLLAIMNLLSFFIIFAYLYSAGSYSLYVWLIAVSFGLFSGPSGSERPLVFLSRIFNPPYLLTNFLSYCLLYWLSPKEVYYLDLKTIDLTRYPRGLYSILDKLEQPDSFPDHLPKDPRLNYFVDPSRHKDPDSPFPSIADRKKHILALDNTVGRETVKESPKKCSSCGQDMTEQETTTHTGKSLIIDTCPHCGSVWLDNVELILPLSPVEVETIFRRLPDERIKRNHLKCPVCDVLMGKPFEPQIPADIEIFRCPSCFGAFLDKNSLIKYSSYRNTERAGAKTRSS